MTPALISGFSTTPDTRYLAGTSTSSGLGVMVWGDTIGLSGEYMAVVPREERWLWSNRKALDSVGRGLKDMQEGRLISRGSFAQFADEDDD